MERAVVDDNSATPPLYLEPEPMLNEDLVNRNRDAIEDKLLDEMENLSIQADEVQSKLTGTKPAVDDAENDADKSFERYELLLNESAERELNLQMQIDHKNEEIKMLRTRLNTVGDRVVPAMPSHPEKEHYVAIYDRNIVGKRRLRVTRSQLRKIRAFDNKLERYNNLAEKILQIKSPNPVNLWEKIRDDQPYMLFGMRFLYNNTTEFEFLDEDELREKFQSLKRLTNGDATPEEVREYKRRHRNAIPKFEALNLADEDDAIAKCFTPSDKARQRICGLIVDKIEEIKKNVLECGERVETASDL